jgi:hypothetical protein
MVGDVDGNSRFGIKFKKRHGEMGCADAASVEQWKSTSAKLTSEILRR